LEMVPVDGYEMDLMTLKEHAQRVEEDFFNSGVMSQISISGYPNPEISVEIKEEELLALFTSLSMKSSGPYRTITGIYQAGKSNPRKRNS
jgi:hypothetical protein